MTSTYEHALVGYVQSVRTINQCINKCVAAIPTRRNVHACVCVSTAYIPSRGVYAREPHTRTRASVPILNVVHGTRPKVSNDTNQRLNQKNPPKNQKTLYHIIAHNHYIKSEE